MFARVAAALLLAASIVHAQGRPRKIFISVDLEGISGVVQPSQLGPDGFEYQRARDLAAEFGDTHAVLANDINIGEKGISIEKK